MPHNLEPLEFSEEEIDQLNTNWPNQSADGRAAVRKHDELQKWYLALH